MAAQPDGVDETVEIDGVIFSEMAANNSTVTATILPLCDN